MSAIQNFVFEDNLVRVVERDGEPWFVGKDVCAALAIKNHNDALSEMDQDERGVAITDPPRAGSLGGGAQEVVVVSEPGVYRLVFRSRKPEAERFKRWLAHDVLPQIRKTGRYDPNAAGQITSAQFDLRLALDMTREARMIYGKDRARLFWESLPNMPKVPDMPRLADPREASARACLAHLLGFRLADGAFLLSVIAEAMASGEILEPRLRALGIRPVIDGAPGIAVATNPQCIAPVFEDTQWDCGRHVAALKALTGATSFVAVKFDKMTSKTTFIPVELFEEAAAPAAG